MADEKTSVAPPANRESNRRLPPVETRFKPGVSGNPSGRPASKPLTDALKRALSEPDAKTRRTNLEEVVRTLVALAKKGKVDAIREILDRIEGKTLSEHKVTSRLEGALERMSEDELEALVTKGALPAWFDEESGLPKA